MIKNRLKEIRMKEHLMDQTEFAKWLDVSKSTFCNWENGVSRPTLEKALEIANKLNKNVNEIWYLE